MAQQIGAIYIRTALDTANVEEGAVRAANATKVMADRMAQDARRIDQATSGMGGGWRRVEGDVRGAAGGIGSTLGGIAQQVQDVAVQWQMGTSAAIIFAQQGPQILGAFGPVGAVIGGVAAMATLAATAFFGFNEEVKETPGYLDAASGAMDRQEAAAKRLIEQIQTLSAEQLRYRQQVAAAEREDLAKEGEALARQATTPLGAKALERARAAGQSDFELNVPFPGARRELSARAAPGVRQARETEAKIQKDLVDALKAGKPEEIEAIFSRHGEAVTGDLAKQRDRLVEIADRNKFLDASEAALKAAQEERARGVPPTPRPPATLEGIAGGGEPAAPSPRRTTAGRSAVERELEGITQFSDPLQDVRGVVLDISKGFDAVTASVAAVPPEMNELNVTAETVGQQFATIAGSTTDAADAAVRSWNEIGAAIGGVANANVDDALKIDTSVEAGYEAFLDQLRDQGKEIDSNQKKAQTATDARRQHAQAIEFEVEASRRLVSAYAQSAEAGAAMQRQIEAERQVRSANIDVHSREGKALIEKIKLQQQANAAVENSQAVQRLRQEISETARLVAANEDSAASYQRVTLEIEAERAARALGVNATQAEIQAVIQLTRQQQDLQAKLKETTALRQARQDRAGLIARGEMTPIGGRPVVRQQTAAEIEEALNIPQIGQTATEQAGAYTDAWKNAIEDLQGFVTDAFQQLFEGQLNSADEFAKSLRSIIARGAANMLSGVIFGGAGGGGVFGGAGGQQPAANNNFAAPFSLSSLMGGSAPIGNYSQMSLEEARRRMMRPTVQAQQAPSLTGWWQGMTPAQQQRMIGLGGMGLATIGGMMGGQVGQFNPQGLMSTVGTGMLMGQGMGVGALGGAGAMLWGSLTGRAAGGGLLGGGLGALGGAGIGFATGGPLGALAGGLLGGLGGFMGGGDREPRNNAAFSFDLGTGRGRQDNSPGPGDPNRQAAVQLVKQLGEAVTAIRRLGFGIGGGTISSSVSRTRTAAEAEAELVDQLRRRVGASDRGFAGHTARVSQATDLQGLLEDIQFGREMSDLIKGTNDFQKAMRDLNATLQGNVDRARAMNASERDLAAIRKAGQDQVRDYIRSQMYDFMATVGEGSDLAPEIRQLSEAFKVAAQQAKTFGFSETELANARTEAMRKFTSQAEEQMRAANDNLRGFIDNLTEPLRAALGPQGIGRGVFSPQAQANQALEQFRETMDAARRDDVEAIQNLPQMAQNAVEAARQFGASGPEFQRIFQEVQRGLSEVLSAQEDRRAQAFADLPEVVARTAGEQIDALREESARTREELEMVRREIRLLAA